ncbi:uncharacterized protein [Haliotis cracherodii]|uniref:uncharacterized protein isoform X1 n=1 Tax=Haliotis cracherodii TaxID=6455 RepID=UPI0039ED0FCC
MEDLLEERFCSIDTEISNQNQYLQQQFEKRNRQNDDIRKALSQIAERLGTPATDNLIKLTDDATDRGSGDKRTFGDLLCLESSDKQTSDTAGVDVHKNTQLELKTLTYSKHLETSLISSQEPHITTASKGKTVPIQPDIQNADATPIQTSVIASQSNWKEDSKHMPSTVRAKLEHAEKSESKVSRRKPSLEQHGSENDHKRKGHDNQQTKNVHKQTPEAMKGSFLKAGDVTCRNDELKRQSSAANNLGHNKHKPASWNSQPGIKSTASSLNKFSNGMEQIGASSQLNHYGTDYVETCNLTSCSTTSDLSSVTFFSDNDDPYDYDDDMPQSYPGDPGNAQLAYTYNVNHLVCPYHGHVLSVRETRYILTRHNGWQKKWSRIDKYRPGEKPPDIMKDLPYELVPTTRPRAILTKQLSTRSPDELKKSVLRSKVGVSKDKSNGSPQGHLMHTLYQMKEIVGENVDMWTPVEEALKKEEIIVPRCDVGVDTILCLDNSGTMPREAYIQIKELAMDFINGIEDVAESHDLEENIGVVTLGSRATVLHHLSNDYGSLREVIDQVECGGLPTDHCLQLQGLLVCLAAMTKGGVCNFGGRTRVPPRIIFVTDGLTVGKVHQQPNKTHDAELLFAALEHMGSAFVRDSVVGPIQVVPYGEAKQAFLSRFLKRCKGNLTNVKEACNQHWVQKISVQITDFMIREKDAKKAEVPDVDTVVTAVCSEYSQREKKQISEIVRDKMSEMNGRLGLTDVFDNISIEADLPDLGTRVVRGPDWRWGDQDDGAAGTVINHGEDGESVWVSWDNGFNNVYRYGVTGNYDVLIADDKPRLMEEEGVIDIGMQVERGPDWRDISDQNGSPGLYGTVIRKRNCRVMVIWTNSTMHEYSFGEGGKFEVSIRDSLRDQMPHMHNDDEPCLQEVHKSGAKLQEDDGRSGSDGIGDSYVWQWRGKDNKWRSYSEGNNKKLKASYKKRPGGSCLIQKDGRSFRVLFKSLVEKSIDDGSTTAVRKLDGM